jgi:hypothetical protein
MTSILTGLEEGIVYPLSEDSNAKLVYRKSYMYRMHNKATNDAVRNLSTHDYNRAEEAYQAFIMTVSLSVKDQEDPALLQTANELKKWVYRSMSSTAKVDQICQYFKWIFKGCQALYLGREIPEPESFFPKFNGKIHPFDGKDLEFLAELFTQKVVRRDLLHSEVQILVQLCNGVRALPYPSKLMVQKSITDVISILEKPKKLAPETVHKYRQGLKQMSLRLGKPTENKSKISLTTSASLESNKEENGKAAYQVLSVKAALGSRVRDLDPKAIGLVDHLGFQVFYKDTIRIADPNLHLYDVAYLPPDEAESYFNDLPEERPPYDFGKAVLLVSSQDLTEIGEFQDMVKTNHKIPLFKGRTKFKPNVEAIKVKASIVQEKGLKSRIITTTYTGKAQIEQLMANLLREYLSKDPFHRVGFDEPDKLWEALKAYEKSKQV